MNQQISDGSALQLEAWLGIDLKILSERFTKSAEHTFAVLDDDIGILYGAWIAVRIAGERSGEHIRDLLCVERTDDFSKAVKAGLRHQLPPEGRVARGRHP